MPDEQEISRRRFISRLAAAGAGAAFSACGARPDGAAPVPAPGGADPPADRAGPTAFLYHPAFLQHDTGPTHPECPARLTCIIDELRRQGLYERLACAEPAPANVDTIALVHSRDYIELVRREIDAGRAQLSTGDTMISKGSWRASLLAAGAACDAVDLVCSKRARNAFCAVRPPGHHSRPREGGKGFCVFNNVAVAAGHAQTARGIERVLVVDWDVHHGNGTQDAFWTDGSVLQFHTHQRNIYPFSGFEGERGEGEGEGRVMNFELAPECGIDTFEKLYLERLVPAAREFRPGIILVSAGYDSHRDDPLGGLALDERGYERLTGILVDLADDLCEGRLVVCLEGGYDTRALGASVAATVRRMMGP